MGFGNLESWVKAILIVSLFSATLSPVFFNTLPTDLAQQLNMTSSNATAGLNNLVFRQTNNTVFCGTAAGCASQNRTGGVYANTNLFTAFAFVLNGFGDLVSSLVSTPFILGMWVGQALSIINLPVTSIATIQQELPAFISFLLIIVCVSTIMKFPMRSG